MPIPHDAALEHSTMVWYPRGSHVRTDTARYRTIQVQRDKDTQGEVPYQRVWAIIIEGNSMQGPLPNNIHLGQGQGPMEI